MLDFIFDCIGTVFKFLVGTSILTTIVCSFIYFLDKVDPDVFFKNRM